MRTIKALFFITLISALSVGIGATSAQELYPSDRSEQAIENSNGPIFYKAPGHDEYHAWYKEIQKKLGITGCCDVYNNDCGPVAGYYYDPQGLYVLLEDGKYHLFTGKVEHHLSETPGSKAHVCRRPRRDGTGQYIHYCAFIPKGST